MLTSGSQGVEVLHSTKSLACCSIQRPARVLQRSWRREKAPRVSCQYAAAAPAVAAAAVAAPPPPPQLAPQPLAPPHELSCELLQGSLVRFSDNNHQRNVPTAVLVHGILGSRRNLASFARLLLDAFPAWQVLLVDLRCHGDSALTPATGPHTVDAAARDVLEALRSRRMFPQMLIGHSFGGKVVLSMAKQFAAGSAALPRPVQVWVLDALPGEVRPAPPGAPDHPSFLLDALRRVDTPLASRGALVDALSGAGFSQAVSQWMTTNLRQAAGRGLEWAFDLDGICELYASYEATCLWDFLRAPPQGLRVDFVRATRSNFRWGAGDAEALEALGHGVHPLEAGHWVHADNAKGLLDVLRPSLGSVAAAQRRASR